MLSKVLSAATYGIEAVRITVEVHTYPGIPGFKLVGLPDTAVRESYARIRSALANCKMLFDHETLVVNLSPAGVRKEGAGFDLPIALGILQVHGILEREHLQKRAFIGELSLDGTLAPIRGALSISSTLARERNAEELVVPLPNAAEAAAVKGIRVIGARSLPELVAHLRGHAPIEPHAPSTFSLAPEEGVDFAEVRGQAHAKRALEVAAAGGHNVMLIGPPGSGKTMLARRLPTILPALALEESIDATRIHSVAGLLPPGAGLLGRRPFRAPHHTISNAGLVGGGSFPRPGEVSLAHHGVLFLDELPEFRRDVLEVLRQPMEDGFVTISRAARNITFPSRFTLVAALNPCPCGSFNDARRRCACTPPQIHRYLSRISGPLLDRIDLQIEVPSLRADEIGSSTPTESSAAMRERVEAARSVQRERLRRTNVRSNGEMASRHLRQFCALDAAGRRLLETALDKLGLSARAWDRILKVARTIADLAGVDSIGADHVAEAVQYRALDKAYFRCDS